MAPGSCLASLHRWWFCRPQLLFAYVVTFSVVNSQPTWSEVVHSFDHSFCLALNLFQLHYFLLTVSESELHSLKIQTNCVFTQWHNYFRLIFQWLPIFDFIFFAKWRADGFFEVVCQSPRILLCELRGYFISDARSVLSVYQLNLILPFYYLLFRH